MKKGWLIAGIILTVLGIALFVGALAMTGFDFSGTKMKKTEANTYSVNEVFTKIDIQSEDADVEFRLSADGVCKIECVERKHVKHNVRVEGGVLKVSVQDERSWYDYLNFFSAPQSITVYLPSDQYEDLAVNGSTGDLSVPSGLTFGGVHLKASTGDIMFRASSSGSVNLETHTGDIRAENLHAGDLTLSVSTGRVEISQAVCENAVSVTVSTGKTVLNDLTCAEFASNGSTGDVNGRNLLVSGRLSVERSTGDISLSGSDAEEVFIKTTTGDVTGSFRTPKQLITKTTTGSVHVPDTQSGGKCEISTTTGNIRIDIEKVG